MNWTTFLIILAVLAAFLIFRQMSLASPEAARRSLKEGALLIDVRSPSEYASGHLPGAVNIPLGDLASRIGTVCPDKNRVILLHCLSGSRSGLGVRTLKSLGYAKACNLGSYSRAEGILTGGGN